MIVRVHILVQGLVQGVGFRWFVAREAGQLGLQGFVRNRAEGTVELEAEGERGAHRRTHRTREGGTAVRAGARPPD